MRVLGRHAVAVQVCPPLGLKKHSAALEYEQFEAPVHEHGRCCDSRKRNEVLAAGAATTSMVAVLHAQLGNCYILSMVSSGKASPHRCSLLGVHTNLLAAQAAQLHSQVASSK